ncbi:MAG: HlyD family secretion protein [Cycloclasticus sp.]|jgi:HlyD family secretion protein
MQKKIIIISLAALLLVGGGVWILYPPTVTVAVPRDNVAIEIFALGNVDAKVMSQIGFEVAGRLSGLHADATDMVAKGQLLATLDEAEQATHVEKAKASLGESESSLAKANADIERAKAVLEERQETNRRKQKLVKSGAVSHEAADQSKRDEQVAAAELNQAYGQVGLAKAMIKSAKANIAAEEVKQGQHKLYAPYDGLLIERHKELGSILQASDPLFTLVDPTTRWGKLYVDESRAGFITLDTPVKVRLRSQPSETFEGQVVRIDTESDRVNEERVVYVKCHRCPKTFYLGEQAEAWLQVAMLQQALMVPEKSVERYDGVRGIVWVIKDGRLAKVEIRFGHKTLDGELQVIDGLPEHARIVVSDTAHLKEGLSVLIKEPKNNP